MYVDTKDVFKIVDVTMKRPEIKRKGKAIRNAIKRLPVADVVEVKHGEWLGEAGGFECSVCEAEAPDDNFWPSPYCPCCGAKMDLKEGAANV